MCFAPQWRALFQHRMDIGSSKSGPNTRCSDTFYFEMYFAPQRRALFRHLNFQKWPEHAVICTFLLGNVLRATTAVNFFDIATSKSGPNVWCFATFDFEMCFAPQRRALFPHRNFQKSSEHGVFCAFLLPNVLGATTVCTFSTSQLPKVVRKLTCFDTFYFQMCFAPQRRALFPHLNFQKCSEPDGVF